MCVYVAACLCVCLSICVACYNLASCSGCDLCFLGLTPSCHLTFDKWPMKIDGWSDDWSNTKGSTEALNMQKIVHKLLRKNMDKTFQSYMKPIYSSKEMRLQDLHCVEISPFIGYCTNRQWTAHINHCCMVFPSRKQVSRVPCRDIYLIPLISFSFREDCFM